MAAIILTPVHLACTNTYQDLTAAPAAGKVRRYDVRAANITTADAAVDLILTDGTTTINRALKYPVYYNAVGSAPDLEQALLVPAGWRLQARSTGSSLVEVSATGVEADVADFT